MSEYATVLLPLNQLQANTGQIDGLPKNPRFIRDSRFTKLIKSITDDPEMMHLRECLVYPLNGVYVVIGGNMRLRACKELGFTEIPCKVLSPDTPVEKLRAYTIKDNVGFGNDDTDLLANEWDQAELTDWGVEVAEWNTEATDDYSDKNKEVNLDDYEEKMEFKLKLTSDEFFDMQERLSVVKAKQNVDTNEAAIFELLGFYERHSA